MFKQRKHRSFNYKPRFSNSEENTSDFNKEQNNSPDSGALSSVNKRNVRKQKASKLPVLIVILVILIALMYYLEVKLR